MNKSLATRALYYLLTLWGVLAIQILSHSLGGSGVPLNIALVAVVYMGLFQGPWVGEMMGFLWGILMDASFFGSIGVNALLLGGVGYLSGMLRRQLDETKAGTQALFTFGASFLFIFLAYALDRMFTPGVGPMTWRVLLQPVANAIVAPPLFWIMRRWAGAWNLTTETQ